jgi:hypothetical protein
MALGMIRVDIRQADDEWPVFALTERLESVESRCGAVTLG